MNNLFEPIDVKQLKDNVFHLLDDVWMLISAGNDIEVNMMTASWGGFGILWNKPVAFIFIRPQRYTYQLINNSDVFSLSFFEEAYRKELNFCGTKSGKDVDKIKGTGLTSFNSPGGCYAFKEARLFMECRKIYADHLKPEHFIDSTLINKNYPKNDFHQFTIGEITGCYIKR
jgi:flavin reductase (DIM6/NTAB) family NADH-FMN oxidoreductase RutF